MIPSDHPDYPQLPGRLASPTQGATTAFNGTRQRLYLGGRANAGEAAMPVAVAPVRSMFKKWEGPGGVVQNPLVKP